MKITRKKRALLGLAITAALVAPLASGCGIGSSQTATTVASCAFVVGNTGSDATLDQILYPGQSVDTSKDVWYVPCNSRNFITTDSGVTNANGQKVGDKTIASLAYTADGTPILISSTAYFTINQSTAAMDEFYGLCFKYKCADKDEQRSDVNSSTPGWNTMLGENFGPAVDAVARDAAFSITDPAIYQKHDPTAYDTLAKAMSADFAAVMRAKTGYDQDVFCGSGNSGWKDPKNPASGPSNPFTCTQVRFSVDYVRLGPASAASTTDALKAVNAQRLAQATVLYGSDADFWLGIQDTIAACKAAGTPCNFSFGNGPSGVPMLNAAK